MSLGREKIVLQPQYEALAKWMLATMSEDEVRRHISLLKSRAIVHLMTLIQSYCARAHVPFTIENTFHMPFGFDVYLEDELRKKAEESSTEETENR